MINLSGGKVTTEMGGLAHGSVHARPSAQPPSAWEEIIWRTCIQSCLQNLSQPIKIHTQSFRTLGNFRPPCPPKIFICRGKGVPYYFFIWILIFLWVWSPCKISKPYDKHFWDKSSIGRRERKNAINIGHFAMSAQWNVCNWIFENSWWYLWSRLQLGDSKTRTNWS